MWLRVCVGGCMVWGMMTALAKKIRFAGYEQRATMLRAIGDPYRLQILTLLRGAPRYLGDIVTLLAEVNPRALAQPTVSHHMRVLLRAGLVSREKLSRYILYSLVPDVADRLVAALAEDAES